MTSGLQRVLPALRCPICARSLAITAASVRCDRGHSFDLARQGYLNLAVGRHPHTGDDATMVAARERFLAAEHYRPIAAAVAQNAGRGLLVDLAGGTGYYARHVLDTYPDATALLVDLSTPALRRAARSHDRLAAVGADVWQHLPLADAAATTVLSVFGPRNATEIRRVLAPGGRLVTVTPAPDHLQPLVERLGLISIGPDKDERLQHDFGPAGDRTDLEYAVTLPSKAVHDVVAMGPSARHLTSEQLSARVSTLPDPVSVRVHVVVATFRP